MSRSVIVNNNIHFRERKKSGFVDSGIVVVSDELVFTTIEFAFIYKDVRFRALLAFSISFSSQFKLGGYFPKALLYCLDNGI